MKSRQRVLGMLLLLAIITMVDRVCLSVAGKSIQEEMHLTPSQWGWVLGVFSLAYGLFEIPGGALGDRIGSRKVLTRVVVWWSAFTAITGLVQGFRQLLIVRFLFGAREAGAYPNMATVVQRWFPATERARAQGMIWMASRLGGAISPLLVIPLQHAFGWRVMMQIFGAVGVIWAIAWYFWFRDDPAQKKGVTPAELEEIAVGRSTAAHVAVPLRQVLAQSGLWWLALMYFTYSWSGYFYQGWLFNFLRNGRGYDDADLLKFSWLPFVCGAAANFAGGFASDALVKRIGLKWGRRSIGIGGLALSAVLIGSAFLTQDKVLTLVLLAMGYGASDFMMPSAWAVCLDVGGKNVGTVSGAMNMAGQAGGFSSSVAFGYIVGATGSYDYPLLLLAGLTGCAALLWFKIDPTRSLAMEAKPTP